MKRLLAVVLLAVCVGCSGGDDAPAEAVEVLTVEGDTHKETDDFTVEGRWSLTYDTEDSVNIFVRLPDGDSTEYIPAEAGTATETYRQGGTFYLELDAPGGRYEVRVVDEPG